MQSWQEHLPWLERERDHGRIARLGVAVIVMRPLGEGALVRRSPPWYDAEQRRLVERFAA